MQPQRLDRRIDAAPAGKAQDLVHDIAVAEVQRDVGAQCPGNIQPVGVSVYGDDGRGSQEPGSGRGAQADRALGENRHDVADADIGVFRALEARGHDVRAHQHLFVRQAVGHRRQIGLRVRHEHVFRLGAVDLVAESPAGRGLVTMAAAKPHRREVAAVLRCDAVLGGIRVEVGADRPGDDPLPLLVVCYRAAKFFDDANGLMADSQPGRHRIFAFEDMDIGAADRRRGDAYQGIVGTNVRNRLVDDVDTAGFDKYSSFHHGGHGSLLKCVSGEPSA
ncbi:hypothetical protein D9M68_644070 [compost metagenome]